MLDSAVDEGQIEEAKIEGFGWGGGLATRLVPLVRGTWAVRWPTKLVADYLVRDVVEGGALDELLKSLLEAGEVHLDTSTYGAMIDEERALEIATPLDASSLVPPSQPHTSSALPTPSVSPAISRAPSPAPSSTSLRFHAHLIGSFAPRLPVPARRPL